MLNICICGGGSLGHVCAGVLGANANVRLRIHSRRPEAWNKTIHVTDPNDKVYLGKLDCVTSSYEEALEGCQLLLLCLPGPSIAETLKALRPYLPPDCAVGSIVGSTGFFFHAHELLAPTTPLYTYQRVPFIARTSHYGEEAKLLGYKSEVHLAVENMEDVESFRQMMEELFLTPTTLLHNFYEASLTNSNPILHTGRLYTMWKDWNGTPYTQRSYFYKEWTDEASECILAMDQEFFHVLEHLPIEGHSIPTLLEYYESTDASSLTRKISSIKAFEPIQSPMVETAEGWIPDFTSRYFTEDFPCGLTFIKQLAVKHQVKTPIIDQVLEWGLSKVEHS